MSAAWCLSALRLRSQVPVLWDMPEYSILWLTPNKGGPGSSIGAQHDEWNTVAACLWFKSTELGAHALWAAGQRTWAARGAALGPNMMNGIRWPPAYGLRVQS